MGIDLEVLTRAFNRVRRRAREGVILGTLSLLSQIPSQAPMSVVVPPMAPVTVSAPAPAPPKSLADTYGIYSVSEAKQFLDETLIDVSGNTRSTHRRSSTDLFIVHGTEHGWEGSCEGDLRTLKGEVYSNRKHRWVAKHDPKSHVLVCWDRAYKIQSFDSWVNGAGVSIWKGRTDLSDVAFQAEFETVSYKESDLTPFQKKVGYALQMVFKERYGQNDSAFVTHGQVAYEDYAGRKTRERKRDGFFELKDIGIYNRIIADVDAEAGRVKGSPFQQRLYELEAKDSLTARERLNVVYDFPTKQFGDVAGFVLDDKVTPLVISALTYDEKTSKYLLPNGHWLNGKELAQCWKHKSRKSCYGANWGNIPEGTIMFTYVSDKNKNALRKKVDSFIAAERSPAPVNLSAVYR